MPEPTLEFLGERIADLTERQRAVASELRDQREVLSTLVREIQQLGPRLERAITLAVSTAMMRFRSAMEERVEKLETRR